MLGQHKFMHLGQFLAQIHHFLSTRHFRICRIGGSIILPTDLSWDWEWLRPPNIKIGIHIIIVICIIHFVK